MNVDGQDICSLRKSNIEEITRWVSSQVGGWVPVFDICINRANCLPYENMPVSAATIKKHDKHILQRLFQHQGVRNQGRKLRHRDHERKTK